MTEADRLLLKSICSGDEAAWSRLVRLYQGRLVAFATQQTRNRADAEDAVQDCFVTFLKQLERFRGAASIETYLFQILRHRIIDQYRKQARRPCRLSTDLSDRQDTIAAMEAHQPTPSAYAGLREAQDNQQEWLADALRTVTARYQAECDFDKLRVIEMLFYAQLPPVQIAGHIEISSNTVATIKRRTLQRIGDTLPNEAGNTPLTDTLLTTAWEAARPSCPKRSTIGAYLLGSLDKPWHDYVRFHLETLGCRFCAANFEDLKQQTQDAEAQSHVEDLNARILRSSVGFLPRQG
ncbi:RNA polymerase sigma factor [Algisphaera agarilytica]|uniref:RNA polymerase sigma factor (Sigma-70 family) n=1 Tax=Algisphaera agarilytica TaxID=1385975 RepID=A0A7X0LM16_9BACT|nr:sigma-70 family RNA polymerase sigma factor [Algisphaera agarilytica]MBB6431597.1 RNA polymerase sigma factor (sigma-70 family) [Algisphaera agarilytica]